MAAIMTAIMTASMTASMTVVHPDGQKRRRHQREDGSHHSTHHPPSKLGGRPAPPKRIPVGPHVWQVRDLEGAIERRELEPEGVKGALRALFSTLMTAAAPKV